MTTGSGHGELEKFISLVSQPISESNNDRCGICRCIRLCTRCYRDDASSRTLGHLYQKLRLHNHVVRELRVSSDFDEQAYLHCSFVGIE